MSDFARTSDIMHLLMQIAAGFISTNPRAWEFLFVELEKKRMGFGCQGPAAGKEQEPHSA